MNVREKYELALNPIGSFIELAVAEDSTESDKVIKDDLYRAYTRFCKEKRLAIESKENFGKILKKQFRFQDGREASGLRRTIWKGVKLTGMYNLEDEQEMLGSLNDLTNISNIFYRNTLCFSLSITIVDV